MKKRIEKEWEFNSGQKIVRVNPKIRAKLEEIAAIVAQLVPKGMQDKIPEDLRSATS